MALERRLEAAGRGALLDAHFGAAEFEGLDAKVAARLERMARKRERGLTVRRVLRGRSIRGADRAAVTRWLESQLEGSPAVLPAPPVDVLRPGMADGELRRWAEVRRLGWATEQPLSVLDGGTAYGAWMARRWFAGTSIREALCATSRDSLSDFYSFPRAVQLEAIAWLRARADEAEEVEAFAAAHAGCYATRPDRPELVQAWKRVRKRFDTLRARHGNTVLPAERFRIAVDPPHVLLDIDGHDVVVPLTDELPNPVTHGADGPWHTAAWLGVLHELTHPGAVQDALVEALGRPRWQRDLDVLDQTIAVPDAPSEAGGYTLLAWRVSEDGVGRLGLEPVRCRVTRAGLLQARAEPRIYQAWLGDPTDAMVADLIDHEHYLGRPVLLECLEALAGHARVIPRGAGGVSPIPVRVARLEAHLERTDTGVALAWRADGRTLSAEDLSRAGLNAAGNRMALLDPERVLVIRCTPRQRQLAATLTSRGTRWPEEAIPAILARLDRIQEVVPLQLDDALRGEELAGDHRPVLQVRFDGGVVVRAVHRPLPDGATERPGEGNATVHVVREGRAAFCRRDLEAEAEGARALAHELGLGPETEPFTWVVADLQRALDVVEAFDPERHRVEIDGSLPTLSRIEARQVRVTVGGGRDYFQIGGSAGTPIGEVDLDALIEAVGAGRDWVQVGKGGFARIHDGLAEHLRALTAGASGGKLRLSGVHAPVLDELEGLGAVVEGHADWQQAAARLREAQALDPQVPDTLTGELRPYQRDGFRWLARLAHWAPGAILADDMGLGKTIQAIALLLSRGDGPALVVAPTSVGFNWLVELERFAPSLRARSYRDAGREALLADLGPGDVLVTSYGVLIRDVDALAAVSFRTVVIDEAQAVKNPTSARAKAVRGLCADFVLALSGTPVENRSEELWSVSACTVPGLLGSHGSFLARWAGRVDAGDSQARAALARVVSPFLLRRTKRAVAPELPARTEVVLRVGLSDAHRALYERSRLLAIARLADGDPTKGRFQVLAELTRLRQLACDPRLVDEGSPVHGAKLAQLVRRLEDVRDSGEQALVFSLFVRHLQLARNALEARGFHCAWLTGSTPADERARQVARFQAGEADVFLLSTKAGGTGLNLTAASYVFHLDPWWNPAAEDQATDRAHRIGQDKAVTVYRLVATGTVEEQILDMHADKRDLVEALLDGSGSASVFSVEQLRSLLADSAVGPASASTALHLPEPAVHPPSTAVPKPQGKVIPLRRPRPKASEPLAVGEPVGPAPATPSGSDDAWPARAEAAIEAAPLSEGTRRAYGQSLRRFVRWTEGREGSRDALARAYLQESSPGTAQMFRAVWRRTGDL